MSFEHLKAWTGRAETQTDIAAQAPLAGLAATLDHAAPPWRAGEVPPLAHWLYFLPRTPQHEIGPDGHAKRGGFLPPVELPRRMWAGGEFEFLAPVPIGAAIERRSTIASVEHKAGRSGDMVFVRVSTRSPFRAPRRSVRRTLLYIAKRRSRASLHRRRRGQSELQNFSARSCPIPCCCSAIPR